ncbi:MAG: hypothetical protein DWI58_13890, partial [Chloroflexi bacterium]
MGVSLLSNQRTANAGAPTQGAMTNTGVVGGATSTYTLTARGSANTDLTTITVSFPTNYTIAAVPVVTATGDGASCANTAAAAAAVVTITVTGLCSSLTSLVVAIPVTNPTTAGAYTIGAQAATVGFQIKTSLDTTYGSQTSGAPTITAGATAVTTVTFAGASQVAGATTTWTVTGVGSAATNITTATVVFPSLYTIGLNPVVTVTGGG